MTITKAKQRFGSKRRDWQLSRTESPVQSSKQLVLGGNERSRTLHQPRSNTTSRGSDLTVTRNPILALLLLKILRCKATISGDRWSGMIWKSTKTRQIAASFHRLSHGSNYCRELVLKWYAQHPVTKIRRNICFCLNKGGKPAKCLCKITFLALLDVDIINIKVKLRRGAVCELRKPGSAMPSGLQGPHKKPLQTRLEKRGEKSFHFWRLHKSSINFIKAVTGDKQRSATFIKTKETWPIKFWLFGIRK